MGVAVLVAALLGGAALAQDAPRSPRDTPAAQETRPSTQDDPLAYRLEIYVVSFVTRDDGTREERYTESTEARPGQMVEYRIFVENVSETTLPAGLVQIRLPVPEGTEYVANSATPSTERVLTEFSADRGRNFSEPPVLIGNGDTRSIADPTSYDEIRWTFFIELEPGQEEVLVYRVIVR
jgi:uncharacterized repeat protein (TIGR01451 family)